MKKTSVMIIATVIAFLKPPKELYKCFFLSQNLASKLRQSCPQKPVLFLPLSP